MSNLLAGSPIGDKPSLLLQDLHNVVADRVRDFLEPVGRARWNNDHVALRQVVRLPALDVRTHQLTWFGCLSSDHSSAGHEGCLAVYYVDYIRLFVVHLNLAGLVAVAARDRKVRRTDQRAAFAEGRRYFVMTHVGNA